MAIVIPLPQAVPHFDLTVTLDGVAFTIEFRWNQRALAWFVLLYTAERELIFGSRKLVTDWSLWRQSRDARRPAGNLIAVDTTNANADAGLNDLGTRVQVLYFAAGEL